MISPAQIMLSSSYLSLDAGRVNIKVMSDAAMVNLNMFLRGTFYFIDNILNISKTNIVCV